MIAACLIAEARAGLGAEISPTGGALAFLGFQPVTWVSLIGRVAMATEIVGISATLLAGEK